MIIATLKFNCPKCSTAGEVPLPSGEILVSDKTSIAVWPNQLYTCPGCLSEFHTMLFQVKGEGQVWGINEIRKQSPIIAPPLGPLPPPPGLKN